MGKRASSGVADSETKSDALSAGRNAAGEVAPGMDGLAALAVRSAIDFAIITSTPQGIIDSWSPGAEAIIGWSADEAIGQSIGLIFTSEDRAGGRPDEEMRCAREHGRANDERWHVKADGTRFWAQGELHPLEKDGALVGFVKILRDRTEQHALVQSLAQAREELAGANTRLAGEQQRLRSLFEAAPGFIAVLRGSDHVFELANGAYRQLIGHREVLGMPVRLALPEVEGQGFFELLDRVFVSGERVTLTQVPITLQRTPDAEPEQRFISFNYEPMRDEDGSVSGIFVEGFDATVAAQARAEAAQIAAEQIETLGQLAESEKRFRQIADEKRVAGERLRVSEERYRSLFEAIDAGFFVSEIKFGPDGAATDYRFLETNPAFERQAGLTDARGKWVSEVVPDLEPHWFEIFGKVARTQQAKRFESASEAMGRWFDVFAFPVESARKNRVAALFNDITDRKRTENELVEQARTLETLNSMGAALTGELDLERLVGRVTDSGADLIGAAMGAFFYNVLDEAGESFMLYTLSGARREDFEAFGMPRATAIFHPTFVGEGPIRSDDITRDPRYGRSDPHHGLPAGHLPVTSYLAVPVISRSGEVIGGLFYGHPEPGRFSERHEQLLVGIAAQAAIAIDNARLFDAAQRELAQRRKAEGALVELNQTLENRIAEAIAEREAAEERLRQSQKMEAVGQLTGGIAHDFNNLLTIVSGNIDMARRSLGDDGDPRALRSLGNAMKGADRAAALTQRLLAFSRRQPLQPRAIDVNRLIAGMSEMLDRALGETIMLEIAPGAGLWPVEVDPNQLENAILNLAVNARDAMPDGGRLVVTTANLDVAAADLPPGGETPAGEYVAISVVDTGEGMGDDVVAKAFEPFFSTKEVGKGTGLGLSQVYGYVKQSGGDVKISSRPGEGTTVTLYLPRTACDGRAADEYVEAPAEAAHGQESILVVEDDDDVRIFTVDTLRELGYRVLEAHDGASALSLLERRDQAPHLLLTDVVMPGMSGRQLAEQALKLYPGMQVLYTTGYARDAIVHDGRLDPGVALIAKPFTLEALAAKVREVLENPTA